MINRAIRFYAVGGVLAFGAALASSVSMAEPAQPVFRMYPGSTPHHSFPVIMARCLAILRLTVRIRLSI